MAFSFGAVCPCHRSQLKLCREQGTKQIRFVVAKLSFRQVRDKKTFVVYYEGNAHFRFDLAQNVPNYRVQQKLAELVLDRSNSLALETLIVALILIRPKG